MYYLISVLIIIVSVLLILIVLVQNSKGGGLAANFTGGNQVMGVRKTADFLEKATWVLAILVVVLCLGAAMAIPRAGGIQNKSLIEDQVQEQVDPAAVPGFQVNPEEETTTSEEEKTETEE